MSDTSHEAPSPSVPASATPAQWTAKEVRERVADALDTLRRMRRSRHSTPAGYVSSWPEIIRDFYEAYGSEAPRLPLATPGPSAIARLDGVLPWLFLVKDVQQRKAMLLKAVPLSWRKIGFILGVGHETARGLERRAVDGLVNALNAAGTRRP